MLLLMVISSFVITLILTYLVRLLAVKKSIIDIPNERSSHKIPTPRGGGMAIAVTWFIAITILYFTRKLDAVLYYSLLCGLPIAITGVIDDIFSISPKLRLLIQVVSAIVAIYLIGGLKYVDIGFGIIQGNLLISVFAVVGLIWFTNLFNFLDGIDGYISCEVIFIGIATFIIYKLELPLILAFLTLGFLVWNWQPAKIFMGDVGSTLLGFSIGIFSIYYQNVELSSILVWLMLTSLFWFDATVTLIRRFLNNEVLSNAHKKHAYQRIVQHGFSHQKTVIYSILINLAILFLAYLSTLYPSYILFFLIINIVFLYFVLIIVDKKRPF